MAIDGVNSVAANELGLRDQISSDILLIGDHRIEIPVTAPDSGVLTATLASTFDFTLHASAGRDRGRQHAQC